jgi:hypothetical protein
MVTYVSTPVVAGCLQLEFQVPFAHTSEHILQCLSFDNAMVAHLQAVLSTGFLRL